jgi:hypothetical protein
MNSETNRKHVAVMALEGLEHQPLLVFYLATDQYPPTVIQKLQSDPDFRRNLIFRVCLNAIFVPPPQLLIRGEFYICPCTQTVDYSGNSDGEIVVVDLDDEDEWAGQECCNDLGFDGRDGPTLLLIGIGGVGPCLLSEPMGAVGQLALG